MSAKKIDWTKVPAALEGTILEKVIADYMEALEKLETYESLYATEDAVPEGTEIIGELTESEKILHILQAQAGCEMEMDWALYDEQTNNFYTNLAETTTIAELLAFSDEYGQKICFNNIKQKIFDDLLILSIVDRLKIRDQELMLSKDYKLFIEPDEENEQEEQSEDD